MCNFICMAFQTICLALPIGFSIFKDVMTFLYSFELSFYIELVGLKIESVSSSNGIILFLPTCICILEHYVIGQYIAGRARISIQRAHICNSAKDPAHWQFFLLKIMLQILDLIFLIVVSYNFKQVVSLQAIPHIYQWNLSTDCLNLF